MSNPGSSNNSNVGSPYGSNVDLQDDDDFQDYKVRRGGRGKKMGSLDMDDVECTVRSVQQDVADINSEFSSIRSQSQGQTRRIHDLQVQFEEARVRLDKLLRRTRTKSDYDLGGTSPSLGRRTSDLSSSEYPSDISSMSTTAVSISSSSTSSHKSEISFNPASKAKPSFGTVTLTVNVDEDEA